MGLFTPIWMTNDILKEEKAIKRVEKMSRQDQLREVALNAPRRAVRLAAVERLTDQNALYEIIEATMGSENTNDWDVCRAARDKISDQMLLERLALNPKLSTPGIVKKLINQSLLEKFAMEEDWHELYPGAGVMSNRNSAIQCAAISKLQSQDILKKIFFESADNHVRLASVKGIIDQEVLHEAAYQDKDPQVRLIAAEKLGLTDVISEVNFILQVESLKKVPKEKSNTIEKAEIEAISDKSALIDIYLHARSPWIRSVAQKQWIKLQPTQQELVQLLLQNNLSTYNKRIIVPMIRKNGLVEIIQNIEIRSDDDERTVLLVLERIKSFREILLEIYEDTGKNSFIREEAWTLLVKHHRKYLAEKGMKEEADKTAAYLRESEKAWKKHLDEVSDAIEQYGGI